MAKQNTPTGDATIDNGIADVATNAISPKREKITVRKFYNAAGEDIGNNPVGATRIDFEFADGSGTVSVEGSQLSPEILNALAFFGLKTSLGNAMTGAKDDAREAFDSRLETLLSGEWREGSAIGEQVPSMLAQAMVLAKSDAGQTVTVEDMKAALKAGGKDFTKKIGEVPQVKAHYARLRAEAAVARATKLEAAAGATVGSDLGF